MSELRVGPSSLEKAFSFAFLLALLALLIYWSFQGNWRLAGSTFVALIVVAALGLREQLTELLLAEDHVRIRRPIGKSVKVPYESISEVRFSHGYGLSFTHDGKRSPVFPSKWTRRGELVTMLCERVQQVRDLVVTGDVMVSADNEKE